MKNTAIIVLVAAALVGCASKETKTETPVTERSSVTQPQASTSPGATTMPSTQRPVTGNPLVDPSNILSKRSVFFDYDSNSVKDEYRGLVQAHSRYLGDKRDSNIRIEGNCDERGSREYNLALGQRRAEAVVKSLTLLGADTGQLEAVSFGKERPAVQGENEDAWAKNRRAELASR
jgi:peptidoglycan-associated lipoprotein